MMMANIMVLSGQNINLQLSSTVNRICNGFDCDYNGPSILINEVMLSPTSGDGSIYGTVSGLTTQGEWIELYNPDQCNSVDISCYFLGNNAPEGGVNYGTGFLIPPNTIVPPQGFCVIRGILAPAVPSQLLVANGGNTVEIVLNWSLVSNICLGGGNRLWFPNAGGWFAFYDRNGVPQDAISWNSVTNSCMTCQPCNPGPLGVCNYAGTLASYSNIPASRKTYILSGSPALGYTYRRIPDGGNWAVDQSNVATMGNCNSICNPPPVITCNGTATVSASGGVPPYTYKWNDAMNQTTPTATGLCEGTYCVTVTDNQSQTAVSCVQVQNLALQVSVTTALSACEGEQIFINVVSNPSNSNDNYTWAGPAGFTSSSQNNVIPNALTTHSGQYIVIVEDSNQCFGKDTLNLSVYPKPVVTATSAEALICRGETTTLTATGASSYMWSGGLASGATHIVSPSITTTYTVTGTDQNGCKDTAEVLVEVIDLNLVITPLNPSICDGDVIQLHGTSNAGQPVYSWDFGANTPTITISPTMTTNYTLVVVDENGCSDTVQTTVTVNPIPSVEFSASPLNGCIPLNVFFTNLSDAGNASWNFGDGSTSAEFNPVHNYMHSGYFTVTLKIDALGCENTLSKSDYVYVFPKPYAGFRPSALNVFEDNPYVSFTDLSHGAISWHWDFGTGTADGTSTLQNPDYTFPEIGEYHVWQFVENEWNCKDSAYKYIIVKPLETIYFPNAFSPNNDGVNDWFMPLGNGSDPNDYQMLIFDRWGNLVFSTDNINIPWKGDSMDQPGKILQQGVYVYSVKINFSGIVKIYRGIVTLIF